LFIRSSSNKLLLQLRLLLQFRNCNSAADRRPAACSSATHAQHCSTSSMELRAGLRPHSLRSRTLVA
jgi:hypothetical protein